LFIELFNIRTHYTSTFLHKGCLPIPQLFGARNCFHKREGNPPVCDPTSDNQRKWAKMNLQLNFLGEMYLLHMTNQYLLHAMTGHGKGGHMVIFP
jgi:hypothetical protein